MGIFSWVCSCSSFCFRLLTVSSIYMVVEIQPLGQHFYLSHRCCLISHQVFSMNFYHTTWSSQYIIKVLPTDKFFLCFFFNNTSNNLVLHISEVGKLPNSLVRLKFSSQSQTVWPSPANSRSSIYAWGTSNFPGVRLPTSPQRLQ